MLLYAYILQNIENTIDLNYNLRSNESILKLGEFKSINLRNIDVSDTENEPELPKKKHHARIQQVIYLIILTCHIL
jgi:hypothetical protein